MLLSQKPMHLRWFEYVLWFAAPVLQVAIAAFMVKRKFRIEYPFFFSYTVFQVLSFIVQFTTFMASQSAYYYAYWACSALGILLSFGVMQEIFYDAFRPYEALRELSVILFRWSAVLLLLVVGASVALTNVSNVDKVTMWLFSIERSIRMMQCGLVLFLFFLTHYLGITKRHLLFGIALGYGMFAGVNLTCNTLMAHVGHRLASILNTASSCAYVVAVITWFCYVALPQPERRKAELLPQSEKWNVALAGAMEWGEPDGFLVGMERTVDRLLHERSAEEYMKRRA